MTDQKIFVLNSQCPLYLFIREQMPKRRIIASGAHSNATRLRLVEPIISDDGFDKWEYDHLHGLFDLDLVPHNNANSFPARWCLAENVSIYGRIEIINSNENTTSSSHYNRSCPDSLEDFIRHICAQKNNKRSEDWLGVLREADICNLEDLISLERMDWERIPQLTVNAKRILRAAADRHRSSVPVPQHQQITTDPIGEEEKNNLSSLQIGHLINIFALQRSCFVNF